MSVSHRKQCERARAKWDRASDAFCTWAIANGYGHIRRSDLESALAGVPEGLALLAADRATRDALEDAENAAVSAGHAWRGTYGIVSFYSPSGMRRFNRAKTK